MSTVENTQGLISVVEAAATEFTPTPIPPEDILEGSPEVCVGPAWTSQDGSKMAGISRMTVGSYRYHSEYHETAVVRRGHLRVTLDDGSTYDARPGDVVHMQPGARAVLTVVEDFEDYYVITSPNGPIAL